MSRKVTRWNFLEFPKKLVDEEGRILFLVTVGMNTLRGAFTEYSATFRKTLLGCHVATAEVTILSGHPVF